MAPPGISNWKRPYTSIYNDNYKYGTGLYSDTLGDIEKRYSDSLSKTQLRSDRPDLAFTTFAGSNLTSSPTPGESSGSSAGLARQTSRSAHGESGLARQTSRSSPVREQAASMFESRLSSALHSSYALDEEVQDRIASRAEQRKLKAGGDVSGGGGRRPKSLYDDAVFWSLPKTREAEDAEVDYGKRRVATPTNGPSASHWREKSRLLQEQVESLESHMSSVGNKLQSELSSLKSKYQTEISDLNRSVDITSQQASDVQKLCKRQANQLMELQSAYEDSQRNVSDALEEVNLWQNKCRCIKKEMDRLREEVELAVQKTSRA